MGERLHPHESQPASDNLSPKNTDVISDDINTTMGNKNAEWDGVNRRKDEPIEVSTEDDGFPDKNLGQKTRKKVLDFLADVFAATLKEDNKNVFNDPDLKMNRRKTDKKN